MKTPNIKEKVLKEIEEKMSNIEVDDGELTIRDKEYLVIASGTDLTWIAPKTIDLTLAEVGKVIDEIIVEEEGDSTHDMQIKAYIHSLIKQALGIK